MVNDASVILGVDAGDVTRPMSSTKITKIMGLGDSVVVEVDDDVSWYGSGFFTAFCFSWPLDTPTMAKP